MVLDRKARIQRTRQGPVSTVGGKGKAKALRPASVSSTHTYNPLHAHDPVIYDLVEKERRRQQNTLQLIAAENRCSAAVRAALGSVVQDKTTEGFVGHRYHGGCEVVDRIETVAVERARQTFRARYANVQPHSGTTANHIVFNAVLQPGDRILSLGLDQGGHVSHGAQVSATHTVYDIAQYRVDRQTLLLDYDAIEAQALKCQPKLIICGATAYSRTIDFARFRRIAERVDAYLLADISHIAGLVIAGLHPSPINEAHFTTTSTYKPGGPRGGLILMGRDYERPVRAGRTQRPLWEHLNKTTFPGVQGTPQLNNIAAKAVFFLETLTGAYKARQLAIRENAAALAGCLMDRGFDVLTGGTDNHMILLDVTQFRVTQFERGLTGAVSQRCLEACGIIVNMNRLPYDRKGQSVTSGIRLGTPIVTHSGMQVAHMAEIADLLASVLTQVKAVSDTSYHLEDRFVETTRDSVRGLCRRFPIA